MQQAYNTLVGTRRSRDEDAMEQKVSRRRKAPDVVNDNEFVPALDTDDDLETFNEEVRLTGCLLPRLQAHVLAGGLCRSR